MNRIYVIHTQRLNKTLNIITLLSVCAREVHLKVTNCNLESEGSLCEDLYFHFEFSLLLVEIKNDIHLHLLMHI